MALHNTLAIVALKNACFIKKKIFFTIPLTPFSAVHLNKLGRLVTRCFRLTLLYNYVNDNIAVINMSFILDLCISTYAETE